MTRHFWLKCEYSTDYIIVDHLYPPEYAVLTQHSFSNPQLKFILERFTEPSACVHTLQFEKVWYMSYDTCSMLYTNCDTF